MRTTLDIDDDVLREVRSIARVDGTSLGTAVSQLLRRGLSRTRRGIEEDAGFPVFSVPSDAKPITNELVRIALDES